MHYESTDIIKKYFQTLYKNAGIPWTTENDRDMDKLGDALVQDMNKGFAREIAKKRREYGVPHKME